MANELHIPYITGQALYAQVFDKSNGHVWNGTAYESYLLTHWATYAVNLTEITGTGHYFADFPVDRALDVVVYQRAGGSPLASDVMVGLGDKDILIWNSSWGKKLLANAAGKWVKTGDYLYLYDTDNTTILVTLLMAPAGGPYTSAVPQ